jgi:tRNA A-37 threonylcarbamoyl transferase component Bud32
VPPLKREFSKAGRAITLLDDAVVKVQEPGASRRERLRTLAGQKVGRQTGLFVVPEIVSFDDSRGEIVFERLRMTALREVAANPSRSMELVGRAAEILAAIHRHMESSDGAISSSAVPLHGDFGLRNLFHLHESDRIVVIDWANTDWLGIDADFGAPEIDVATFLVSLFFRRVLGPWQISRRHELAHHFLSTYASASPCGLDIDTLSAVASEAIPGLNRQLRRRKGRLRALGYRPGMIDLQFFLRRLSRRPFADRATSH